MRPSLVRLVSAFAIIACAPGVRGEVPDALLRTDWASDEVIAAPTAGGPDSVPDRLYGRWRVSLCVKEGFHRGHAWIRYENIDTGEVHTVGRFQRNVRPTKRESTGEVLYRKTAASGLHWDYDWRFEHEVREGKYVVGSVLIRDPWIFEHDDPHGHRLLRDNCITYARDAWEYYSGKRYELSLVHTPEGFLRTIETARDAEPGARQLAGAPPTRDSRLRAALRRLPPVE